MTPCIRAATTADVPSLSAVARAAKAHWGYPASWLEQWSAELTISEADLDRFVAFVAEHEGGTVGFCALEPGADGWTLEHLWVEPRAMGREIGRALFDRAVAHIRTTDRRPMFIVSDPNAEGFYLKLGAVRVGEQQAPVDGVARTLPVLRYAV